MNKERLGFIPPLEIAPDNYVLGSVGIPLPVINPSGDWTKYLPEFESQLQKSFDSFGCTVDGTINALTTLENFVSTGKDYSKRFTYNNAEVSPPGDDPHRIITVIRGSGLLEESYLAEESNSLEEYKTPRPIPVDLRIKAQAYLKGKMPGHQWLWTTPPDQATRLSLIKEALTKGTVCVSVTAWYKDNKGLYYSPMGQPNGHWTFVYDIDDTGIYVFDSYNDAQTNTNLKKLTLDHDIRFAKVYFFTTPTQQQNWFSQLINAFFELVGLKQKQLEVLKPVEKPISPEPTEVYNEVKESLMKYDWDTPILARHSVRVICDEEGLSVQDKNDLCATVGGESGWKINIVGKPNSDGSMDFGSIKFGIAQINNKYWIGDGKTFPSTEYVLSNPEACIRWMCRNWKKNKNWWYAFKNGSYKKYLNPKFDKNGDLL